MNHQTTRKSAGGSSSSAVRFVQIETQISEVGKQLSDFIDDSRSYRERVERDQSQIWVAIKEQGEQMNRAIERLSNANRISWPGILATVGTMVSLTAGAAAIGHAIVEGRIKQLEIRDEYRLRETERNRQEIDKLEERVLIYTGQKTP